MHLFKTRLKKKVASLGLYQFILALLFRMKKINNQFFKTTTQICSKNEQQTKGKATERSESLFPGKLMKEQSFCFVFRELPLSLLETVHELFRKSFQKFGKQLSYLQNYFCVHLNSLFHLLIRQACSPRTRNDEPVFIKFGACILLLLYELFSKLLTVSQTIFSLTKHVNYLL